MKTALPLDVEAVMEIVIDGLTYESIAKAMRAGIHAIAEGGAGEGVTHITAGNYGGNLGPASFPSQGDRRVSALDASSFESKPDQRLDLSPLTPSRLNDLKPKEIEAIAIGTTREKLTVGDVFKLKGKDAAKLRFVGTDARCDKIGAGLDRGRDRRRRRRRRLSRRRHEAAARSRSTAAPACLPAPAWAAGPSTVSGDAGERAGGILVGETLGMRGGVIAIGGNAGPMLGERMRRGLVIVGGDAGDYAGGRMIAGTILFKRGVGRGVGHGLRRGSLIFLRGAERHAADLRRLRRARIRLSPSAGAVVSRGGQGHQARRPRAAADGRHVGARQGRDADPRLIDTIVMPGLEPGIQGNQF